ncbi:hypothetical protein Agub_g7864 [Astrephomene gubernaculifera]|uniref:RRM domain-containing protein n=1 Tax=Astrephomene gubernaculifera TaxID=47775 RepID=A0AAD3HMT2_9CHLO|nr:hypothetical protein Agub_g7864 [Astrephomene gubernaculifera]
MGDVDDYPEEHDRIYQEERGYEGTRAKSRDDGVGRDSRYERDRYDREPPRDFDRRRDERDRGDRGDWGSDRGDRRRDDRYDHRGPPPGGRDYRDSRSDPRDYGRERRRSRSRDRRRSRSRDRYDGRRDDRDRERDEGRRGRGGRGRRGEREHSDEEGYGGYRPRRRQVPPDPAKFDKPLPPGAGPAYIQDPFYYLRQNVPTDPAEAQRLWLEQQLRSRQMVLQQQAASAAAASAKTQRELYIGNLVPGAVTDVALRQLFNTTLAAAFPVSPGVEPVVNVNLHSDGRYAFVEFRSPEMATAALALNAQVQLLGQTISVGRPSGYVDPHKAAAAAQAAAQALAAFQAGDMDALAANATAAGMNLAQLGLANLMLPKTAAAGADAAGAGVEGAAAGASGAADTAAATGDGADAGAAAAVVGGQELTPPPAQQPVHTGVDDGQQRTQQQEGVPQGQQGDGAATAAGYENGGSGGEVDGGAPTPFFCVHGMLTADMLQDDEEYEAVLCPGGRAPHAHACSRNPCGPDLAPEAPAQTKRPAVTATASRLLLLLLLRKRDARAAAGGGCGWLEPAGFKDCARHCKRPQFLRCSCWVLLGRWWGTLFCGCR